MAWAHGKLAKAIPAATPGWRGSGKLDWCRGWYFNDRLHAAGMRTTPHSWFRGDLSDPNDYCMVCGRRRYEVMLPKTISLHEALKGN